MKFTQRLTKMAEMRGMTILQNEIEKAKDKLKDVNENIKKLTGRDPADLRAARGRQQDVRGRGRLFGLARRGIMPEESGGPGIKRRGVGGAFSRLGPMPGRRREREDSGDDDEPPTKLSVQSSVVATSRDTRSRQDTLAQQSKDREGLQRNRRMFGLLLGTLQKFKTEAKAQDQKSEQRKQIERKLEEDADRERRRYRQETQNLIEQSQLEQAKISRLQQRMELVNEHAALTGEMRKLQHFIATRTRPRIFWKPRAMNSAADARLKESKKTVDKMIRDKDQALEREICEVMEHEQQRDERVRQRLRGDKENATATGATATGQEPAGGEVGKKGRRHGNREAKQTTQQVTYDDGEESMEEGEGAGKGGEGWVIDRVKQEGEEGGGAVAGLQPGMDDGNNTDVDYEDEQSSEEEQVEDQGRGEGEDQGEDQGRGEGEDQAEDQGRGEGEDQGEDQGPGEERMDQGEDEGQDEGEGVAAPSPGALEVSAIPMPPQPPVAADTTEGGVATVCLVALGGAGGGDGGLDLEALEARRRRAVLAEDGEDLDDEPADE